MCFVCREPPSLRDGLGDIRINGKRMVDYFGGVLTRNFVLKPMEVTDTLGLFDVRVNVKGGGFTGQAQVSISKCCPTTEFSPIKSILWSHNDLQLHLLILWSVAWVINWCWLYTNLLPSGKAIMTTDRPTTHLLPLSPVKASTIRFSPSSHMRPLCHISHLIFSRFVYYRP